MRKLFIFTILLSLPASAFCDSVFELDLVTDISIGAGAVGLFTISQILNSQAGIPADLNSINPIDRGFMAPYSKTLDNISTIAAYGVLIIPVTSVLYEIDFPDKFITYGVMYAEAFLLTFGTKDLLKALVSRYRPYFYLGSVPIGEEEEYFLSFPSGHSSFAFLGATFLSYTFSLEYPESEWKVPIIIASYSLASLIGAGRLASGNHFLTDVISGAAIGSFWGWFVPFMHLKSDNEDVKIIPSPAGVSFSVKL